MSRFEDITRKATDFLKSEQAKDALENQRVEDVIDRLLDCVAGVADRLTSGKHAEKIVGSRDATDRKIGTDGQDRPARGTGNATHG